MTDASAGTRLERRFRALRGAGRGGLVTFITAGDPDPETSASILAGLPAAGADVIELGMPFSDPMADGPAIQAANQRALAAGATLARTLAMAARFRAGDADTPLVLMGYYNPIYRYGVERFLADATAAGVDGLIIVDLPPEEDRELCVPAIDAGMHWIRLATPTTDDRRLPRVLSNTSGFVYYVSVAGITGTRAATGDAVEQAVRRLRRHTRLPIAVGFGIREPDQAAAVASVADAAVVGTTLIEALRDTLDDHGRAGENTVSAVLGKAQALADAVRARGRHPPAQCDPPAQ